MFKLATEVCFENHFGLIHVNLVTSIWFRFGSVRFGLIHVILVNRVNEICIIFGTLGS